jgi:uncharacterized protein (TIGR03067 family)
MTRSLAAGLFVLLLLGFAPAPFPRRAQEGDLKRLQGEWRLVRSAFADEWSEGGQVTLVVRGDQLTFRQGGEALGTWKVRLNASKLLKELDLEGVSGFGLRAGTISLYVYRLEGDELTLWESSSTSGLRPKVIDSSAGLYLWVYRRVKR